jgi:ATP-dependent Lon protease
VIMQLLRLPDGTVKVLVEGKKRARIKRVLARPSRTSSSRYDEIVETTPEADASSSRRSCAAVQTTFEAYVKLNKKIQPEVLMSVQASTSRAPRRHHRGQPAEHQARRPPGAARDWPTGEAPRAPGRADAGRDRDPAGREEDPLSRQEADGEDAEGVLPQRADAGDPEGAGGERDEFKNEIQELEEKLKTKKMSKEAVSKVKKELKKLKMMHPTSAEATVVRNYIDWILELPWYDTPKRASTSARPSDPRRGPLRPEEDQGAHPRVPRGAGAHEEAEGAGALLRGPARRGQDEPRQEHRARTGRKFVRLSLGGVRDEAEIRGHRRTYIGALPGKIVQSLKKAGTNNPVFLLDEVDKMSSDFRGDPAAALLEVLDPEQNHDVQRPLPRPRLRPLRRDVHHDGQLAVGHPGAAARPHGDHPAVGLHRVREAQHRGEVPGARQRKECGLEEVPSTITEGALRTVIHHYTKESGVRSLEREIASLCRKVARQVVAEGKDKPIEIRPSRRPEVPRRAEVPRGQGRGARRGRARERAWP